MHPSIAVDEMLGGTIMAAPDPQSQSSKHLTHCAGLCHPGSHRASMHVVIEVVQACMTRHIDAG